MMSGIPETIVTVTASSSMSSSRSQKQTSEDAVLEKMLMEAERLAVQMRSSSHRDMCHDDNDSSTTPALNNTSQTPTSTAWKHHAAANAHHHHNLYDIQQALSNEEEQEEGNNSEATPASSQPDEIQAAIEAARKMELALEALGSKDSEEDDDDDTQQMDSPMAKSPPGKLHTVRSSSPNVLQRKLQKALDDNNSVAARSTATNSIKWEKVQAPSEHDHDYVPLADYSNMSKKSRKGRYHHQHQHQQPNMPPVVASRRQSYVQATKRRTRLRRKRTIRAILVLAILGALTYGAFVLYKRHMLTMRPEEEQPVVVEEEQVVLVEEFCDGPDYFIEAMMLLDVKEEIADDANTTTDEAKVEQPPKEKIDIPWHCTLRTAGLFPQCRQLEKKLGEEPDAEHELYDLFQAMIQ